MRKILLLCQRRVLWELLKVMSMHWGKTRHIDWGKMRIPARLAPIHAACVRLAQKLVEKNRPNCSAQILSQTNEICKLFN